MTQRSGTDAAAAGLSGRIFDVSRACVDDGPGLRTVVFMKGCPLECPWCHNPEGRSFAPEIALDARRCIGCGECRSACPLALPASPAWRGRCTACGVCAAACPSGARRVVGREVRVADILDEAQGDLAYLAGTGGGVTFSGGEPLAQARFVLACADALRAGGVHVAVETSGLWPGALVAEIVRRVDLVLLDLKHVDPAKLRILARQGADILLPNLHALLASGVPIELRLTLVPGFNTEEADLLAIARRLVSAPRRVPLRLQPFHRLAASKEALLGRVAAERDLAPLPPEEFDRCAAVLRRAGVPC